MSIKTYYRNRLPHIAPIGATFFVTFRLGDSLPQTVFRELSRKLREEKLAIRNTTSPADKEKRIDFHQSFFEKYERQLDGSPYGACYLGDPEVAQILADRLHAFDGELYELQAYCIMPNHVHLLLGFWPQAVDEKGFYKATVEGGFHQLDKVMKLIKGGSSYLINKALGRSGPLWAKDSYDHFVRNDQSWGRILNYIVNNPVKAGLIKEPEEWPFTYVKIIE
jgi:hypothetical protein